MASSDSGSRGRHHRRSSERDRSPSRSRDRDRGRCRDRDFRPHLRSRTRSRSSSRYRSYRSRSDSRERYFYHSPDSRYGHKHFPDIGNDHHPELYFHPEDSPPAHWNPGASKRSGQRANDLGGAGEGPSWRSGPAREYNRHTQHLNSSSEGRYLRERHHYRQPDWGPPHDAFGDLHWPADAPFPRSRHHESDWDGPHSRERRIGLSRDGSGSDRDWDMQRQAGWQDNSGEREIATASVLIKGVPDDTEEADIYKLFEAYPNIQSVKVLRDKETGRNKGLAFVDFATSDDARLLMEAQQRWSMTLGGQRLLLDYSHGAPSGRLAGGAGEAVQDWICDMCSAVNFARRLECYNCYTARPAQPRRIAVDLNAPSNILKVSGLEASTSEEGLYEFCAAVVPNVVDLRVIKDKYTGAPRGFAFVECTTIAEAGSLMVACQGQVLPGQSTPLKICYAKAKEKLLSSTEGWQGATAAAASVGQAATAAAATTAAGPLGWMPKEFNATAVLESGSPCKHDSSTITSSTADSATASARQQQQQQQPSTEATPAPAAVTVQFPQIATVSEDIPAVAEFGGGVTAAAAAADLATMHALTQAGFEFQPSSGYWYDAKSGYHYDATTQLYYHHSTNQWYQYDHSTGQYCAMDGEQQQQHQQQVGHQQAFVAGLQQQPSAAQQQQQSRKQLSSDLDKRRRAAMIGSAPQYNREGLLAAAALAKERDEEQKRTAAAKAARDRQQQQQNKSNSRQQQLMHGKPGIGALPGTGTVGAPAAAAVPAAQVLNSEGSVQGVVYKSRWAQRQQR